MSSRSSRPHPLSLIVHFLTISLDTGSSVLFGAYIAGLTLTYICQPLERSQGESADSPAILDQAAREGMLSFEETYGRSIGPIQSRLLAPLFFASIGYAIVREPMTCIDHFVLIPRF